ncbi:peptidoglycan-binding protein [Ruegeria lacuscaerulensis]|uniref:peptidoglycan-binding protein n=1 Tax=Ruegeria lacuscaerulensis TaxID=55218 RepID=UPI001481276A|nr:adenylate/guanylate cyclase domain-containing protein [Ruegeria lacuscaerulensis]
MALERRIAAVLASDMVGFSRLIELDEEGTLSRQKKYRLETVEPTIERLSGSIIKFTGDGLLAEFASVVQAVQCAVHIQNEIAEREAEFAEDRRIQYRMAINLGDVVFDDGDIFGDGVNVAARLESLAPAGGVLVSGSAYDLLKNQIPVRYHALGKKKLKNIATPVRVYSVETKPVRQGAKTNLVQRPRHVVGTVVAILAVASLGTALSVDVGAIFERRSLEERFSAMVFGAQEALKEQGFLKTFESGVLGRSTRLAITEFQQAHGLETSSILNAETMSSLGVSNELRPSDWNDVLSSSHHAQIRVPEVFEYLCPDDRLTRAAQSLENLEFAFANIGDSLYVAVASLAGLPSSRAMELAEESGGYLVSISSIEENEFVHHLTSRDPKFWRLSGDGNSWVGPGIGLFQEEGAEEPRGGWRWHSGEEVMFTNWFFDQPNDWGNSNENVATLWHPARRSSLETQTQHSPTWGDDVGWFYSFVVEID